MAVNPMLTAGANSIQTGMRGLEATAQDIAEFNVADTGSPQAVSFDSPAEVADAIIDLKVYQRQVQASAKVVQTADEVIGFLLDIS